MKCRVYGPDEAPPVYGRGTRVKFKRTLSVGTEVLNQLVRCDVDRGSTGTIVSVFPSTVIDVDTDSAIMRVRIRNAGRLKDDFDIIEAKPSLMVVK